MYIYDVQCTYMMYNDLKYSNNKIEGMQNCTMYFEKTFLSRLSCVQLIYKLYKG